MRLVVYTDYLYRERAGTVFAERAFVRFIGALAHELGGVRLLGRLDHGPGPARYPLEQLFDFVALPHYARLTDLRTVIRSVPGTVIRMWRALEDADTVFAFGPAPHAITLAALAVLRRRRLVLGVRQDYIAYIRHRYRGRRDLGLAACVLEAIWQAFAHWCPVVAVGADLAACYRTSPRVLETTISLVGAADVEAGARAAERRAYSSDQLVVLTVGRLEAEKNPLLLADVLVLLRARDRRWRLVVCGEGDLASAIALRIERLGLSSWCELRGYVALDGSLLDLYRGSHAFLHVSHTDGLPQVLIEAYASGLPTVATAVGGVRALGDCSLLVGPDDAPAAAAAVQRLADDAALRRRLIAAGLRRVRERTLEAEAAAVARFLAV